jgi:uncharacterized SAM-binding protein YcdF (DUF218 family)
MALAQRRLAWLFCPLVVLVGLISCWIFGAAVLSRAGRWLDIGQPPARTDYAVVLPGEPNTRPYVAAALANKGWADQVVLIQCVASPEDSLSGYPSSEQIEQRVLLARGVPQDRIRILETASLSTFSDAESLKAFLEQTGGTATVVTNDYHTRRARFAFRRVFSGQLPEPRFVSAPTDRFCAANWWRHKKGLLAYLGEYFKLTFYFFRYGTGVTWSAVIVTAIVANIAIRRRHWPVAGHSE